MSICRPLRLLLIGSLLLIGLGGVSSSSAVAQSVPDRPAPRSSSPSDLPTWAEPQGASSGEKDPPSPTSSSPEEQMETQDTPGFPGDDPEQEVPLGGGGGAVLLSAAGAAYGIRRLRDSDDPNRTAPSD